MKFRIPYWYLLLLPTFLYYIGGFLNLGVMTLNHGQMPVQIPPELQKGFFPDERHCLMTAESHVKFLCDWLQLGFGIASPGDLLIWLGDKYNDGCLLAWSVLMVKDSNGS